MKEAIKEKKALKRKREETKEDAGFVFEFLFCQRHSWVEPAIAFSLVTYPNVLGRNDIDIASEDETDLLVPKSNSGEHAQTLP